MSRFNPYLKRIKNLEVQEIVEYRLVWYDDAIEPGEPVIRLKWGGV